MTRQAIDTYRDSNQRRALGRVADAKPEESQGYTAADGEQLAAMAAARDENGNPYYQIEAGEGGGYGVRSNFQTQGDDGTMSTPGVVGMAPRKVTDFMGQRYEGSLDAKGLDNARTRAYADVISRDDPIKGMQMRRELATQERDEQRFEHEKALQPMQQRAAELGVKKGERDERAGERGDLLQTIDDQIAQMPEDALKVYAQQVNTNVTDIPMLFVGKTKDGFQFLSRDPKTGEPGTKPMTFNAAQMRDLARVSIYASTGFGKESQELLRTTSKELHDALYKDAQLTASTVQSGNDARSKQFGHENDQARLGLDEQRLGLERQRVGIAARSASAAAGQSKNLKEYVNAQGETVLVDTGALKPGPDGVIPLPAGLRPKTTRTVADQAAVITTAEKLVQSGMRDPDDPAQPISMEKAIEYTAAQFSGKPYVSASDRLLDAYIEAKTGGGTKAAPAQPKPAGRGLLTDKQGKTQLLEPFTRLNDFRKRMIANDNGNHGNL